MKFLKKIILIPAGALLAPLSALAATPAPPITKVQGLVDLLCAAFGWLFFALIALSLVMIILAAFNYVTANGEPEKVSKATKMILYAVIGIAVALLAKGIPYIIGNFLGASGNFGAC